MRIEHCEFECNLRIGSESPSTWAVDFVRKIPDAFLPQYFGRSDRLRRSPAFEVQNEDALHEYLCNRSLVFLFGTKYELMLAPRSSEASIAASSLRTGMQFILQWLPRVEPYLYYATAGVPAEFDHRNGYILNFVESPEHKGHGWVGRDLKRYIPGLYWLNYWSREFCRQHGIDVVAVSRRLQASMTELTNGFLVQLYDSPASWVEWTETVDDVLFETPGFFSKRRVVIPEVMTRRESTQVSAELWKQWP